ncbi:MAG: tryptophan synthase subunit alpha [Chitinophagaceae bacterium]|nr:MAG: tryptophan synthase subunit alpha [Chitinophagaceae bacterium]
MNRLDALFAVKPRNVLNVYCTAGFPSINSTPEIMLALQQHGADIIEVGMPYSDPVADGPVIQQSNMKALENGMSIRLLFEQLQSIKDQLTVPVVLMGYINPVLQYGMEAFCEAAAAAGVSALILPDLPMFEYEQLYQSTFNKFGLHAIFLITPVTPPDRIARADRLSGGFLYAVSSASTTGATNTSGDKTAYFKRLKKLKLKNPLLIGFGIKDRQGFEEAASYASGAIIGSAFIEHIENAGDANGAVKQYLSTILGN